eukprot:scaffold1472_cov310-Prasinococcus_capsulatus_cf.AAC.3
MALQAATIAALQTKDEEATAKLAEQEEELEQLRAQVADQGDPNDEESSRALADEEDVGQDDANKDAEIEVLRADLVAAQQQLDTAKDEHSAELEELAKEKDELNETINLHVAELASLKTVVDEKDATLLQKDTDLQDMQVRMDGLQREFDDYKNNAEDKLATQKAELTEMEARLKEAVAAAYESAPSSSVSRTCKLAGSILASCAWHLTTTDGFAGCWLAEVPGCQVR